MISFKKIASLIIGIILCPTLWAQNFPVDTSFTLRSAYKKEIKYRPYIKPVYPAIPKSIEAFKDIVYVSYGERELHIDIYREKDGGNNKPAVVFIHGGGWSSGNKTMEAPLAIYLAQKGYLTATVEYRLSPEAKYPAGVIDVKTAIRWLRKNSEKYGIDTSRIAVSGTSSGAQMASLIATTGHTDMHVDQNHYPAYSNKIQALINIDGVLAFLHPLSSEGLDKPGKPSAATRWFGSNKSESKPLWEEASALNHVDANTPPTLFINSQHPRFHAGRDDMIEIMDSLNIYSEVHEIPDTPHPFWLFEPWFEQTAKWAENFLINQFESEKK
jgi:acetyl esterase/lipase